MKKINFKEEHEKVIKESMAPAFKNWSEKSQIYPRSCNYKYYSLNRYKDVMCPERTRVRLWVETSPMSTVFFDSSVLSTSVEDTSNNKVERDYINANYIKPFGSNDTYIATQGPMESTTRHFYDMVWQENSGLIISLGKVKEGKIVKFYQYWPNKGKNLKVGNFDIQLLKEVEHTDYTHRTLKITHMYKDSYRLVEHLHYTTWPDHNVPKTSKPIIDMIGLFHKIWKENSNENTGPPIIHCSAGIGRTGTFITLSTIIKDLNKSGKRTISEDCVPNIVKSLREQRHGMLKSTKQYIFIYKTLQNYISNM